MLRTKKEPKAKRIEPFEQEGNLIRIQKQAEYQSVDEALLGNYGCWKVKYQNSGADRMSFQCQQCKIILKWQDGKASINKNRPHPWSNKSHINPYICGFQLFPTVETFVVREVAAQLVDKAKGILENKLERFVKEETRRHQLVERLISKC